MGPIFARDAYENRPGLALTYTICYLAISLTTHTIVCLLILDASVRRDTRQRSHYRLVQHRHPKDTSLYQPYLYYYLFFYITFNLSIILPFTLLSLQTSLLANT